MEKPPAVKGREDKASKQANKKGKRMPSPCEMVSYYEKQGMETQEASLKVIQDLQGALFKVVAAKRKPNSSNVTSDKLDAIHFRLLHLERELDAKPSYPQALAFGVVSAGIWDAAVQIWSTVHQTTTSSHPS